MTLVRLPDQPQSGDSESPSAETKPSWTFSTEIGDFLLTDNFRKAISELNQSYKLYPSVYVRESSLSDVLLRVSPVKYSNGWKVTMYGYQMTQDGFEAVTQVFQMKKGATEPSREDLSLNLTFLGRTMRNKDLGLPNTGTESDPRQLQKQEMWNAMIANKEEFTSEMLTEVTTLMRHIEKKNKEPVEYTVSSDGRVERVAEPRS